MDRLILANGTEYGLIAIDEAEHVGFIIDPGPVSLSQIRLDFGNPQNTKDMKVATESGSVMNEYVGYVDLYSIVLKDDTVTVYMDRPDEVAVQLRLLSQQMTDAELALCELYEMIIGGTDNGEDLR